MKWNFVQIFTAITGSKQELLQTLAFPERYIARFFILDKTEMRRRENFRFLYAASFRWSPRPRSRKRSRQVYNPPSVHPSRFGSGAPHRHLERSPTVEPGQFDLNSGRYVLTNQLFISASNFFLWSRLQSFIAQFESK